MTVRRPRTAGPLRIAVTGGATGLGAALLERLAARTDLTLLVGLDGAPGAPDGVQSRRRGGLEEQLTGVTTVVHLAPPQDALAGPVARRALTVDSTAALLQASRAAGVRRVVLLSSAEVYGAHPGLALPAAENVPLLAAPGDSLTGAMVELERLADHAGRTGLEVAVLRPTAVIGARLGAAYDGGLLLSLAGARLLAVRGVEPLWQLCHVEDLLSALELVAVTPVTGGLVVASDGWLTQREVERLSGRRRLELPAAVAISTAERLHRVGVTPGSPSELDRLQHPLVLQTARLRALGWTPGWTAADALAVHLELRAGSGRAGALASGATAAGATVALTVTAALVRRARARRGR